MIKRRHLFALSLFSILATTAPLLAQGGAAPVNDHCGDVTPLALAVDSTLIFTGNTVGATVDGDNVPGSGLDDFNVPVVWVAFTTTQCANVTVSYCGSTTPFLDQYFWNVIGPDCPMDQVIVTNDYNNSECPDGQPVIHFGELPPATYYFPVWADQSGAIGDYTITVSASACAEQGPANDLCSGTLDHAVAPEATLAITGDNTGATDSEGLGYAGVWESFTLSQCANVTVDYCGTAGFSAFAYGLYADCPANTLIDTTASDTCIDGNLSETFIGLAPGTYWIPVKMVADSAMGAYSINVTTTACAGPANNYCNGAEAHALALGDTVAIAGDNTGATDNEDLGFAGVWESFSITECANVTVDYCGTAGFDAFAYGLYADCPATALIDTTASDTCTDGNLTETFQELAPGTYWIPVLMVPGSAEGGYAISVTAASCAPPLPVNDACDGAMVHELAIGDTLQLSGDNTGSTDADGLGFAGVWESFSITECANVTVDYCGTAAFSVFAYGLYADCPATALIDTTATDTCADGNLSETFNALAPGTYWIPVLLVPDSAEGAYAITVTTSACEVIVVPANDLCADAMSVEVVIPTACDTAAVAGDNTGATGSGDAPVCGAVGAAWQDVWFTFNSGNNSQVVITMTPGTITGAGLEVFAACGDTTIACSSDGSAITLPVDADTSYVVRVFTQEPEGTPGAFMLCITGDHTTGVRTANGNDLRIFPNPSDGNFTLVPQHSTGDAVITLLDMTGRTVHTEHAHLLGGEAYDLSVRGILKPGTYLLQLATPEGISVQRLMVK